MRRVSAHLGLLKVSFKYVKKCSLSLAVVGIYFKINILWSLGYGGIFGTCNADELQRLGTTAPSQMGKAIANRCFNVNNVCSLLVLNLSTNIPQVRLPDTFAPS